MRFARTALARNIYAWCVDDQHGRIMDLSRQKFINSGIMTVREENGNFWNSNFIPWRAIFASDDCKEAGRLFSLVLDTSRLPLTLPFRPDTITSQQLSCSTNECILCSFGSGRARSYPVQVSCTAWIIPCDNVFKTITTYKVIIQPQPESFFLCASCCRFFHALNLLLRTKIRIYSPSWNGSPPLL